MPRKGYKQTKEHKKNIGNSGRGEIRSKQTRENMSKSQLRRFEDPMEREKQSKIMYRPEVKAKIKATRIKNGTTYKVVMSRLEVRAKMRKAAKGKPNLQNRGNKNGRWKGGISSLASLIRGNLKYRQWRDDIFTRDDFTCQKCGQKGVFLNAHHIKSFSSILQKYEITTLEQALECQELFSINNGIAYCEKCHKKYRKLDNCIFPKRCDIITKEILN